MLSSDAGKIVIKNPCKNSGTSGLAASPVVPRFPQSPYLRGRNSEKYGTGPELPDDHLREWLRSYIAVLQYPKAGGDVVRPGAGTGREICLSPHQDHQGSKGIRQSTNEN